MRSPMRAWLIMPKFAQVVSASRRETALMVVLVLLLVITLELLELWMMVVAKMPGLMLVKRFDDFFCSFPSLLPGQHFFFLLV
jgi:hypothetical protein